MKSYKRTEGEVVQCEGGKAGARHRNIRGFAFKHNCSSSPVAASAVMYMALYGHTWHGMVNGRQAASTVLQKRFVTDGEVEAVWRYKGNSRQRVEAALNELPCSSRNDEQASKQSSPSC